MTARRLVVLSPGARSLPLVLALAREPELDLVDVLDERAAAFFALGHARATGEAAVVVATSGTAPAHWYPAVLEASEARLPLVCLSADRPTELHHCGAPQTVDQLGLFGAHVRFSADLGDPQADPRWLAGVRRTVAQALARAAHPTPGPVHVDFRARKPLEPTDAGDATALAAQAVVDGILGRRVARLTTPQSLLWPAEAARIAGRLARAERPLVVLGPLSAHVDRGAVVAFLAKLGAPFFAEATSQLRFGPRPEALAIDGLDLALGAVRAPSPDLLVFVGGTPTSSALDRFVSAHPSIARVVLGAPRWTDPWASAEEIVIGEPSGVLSAVGAALPERTPSAAWLESLRALDARSWSVALDELATSALGEGHVAAAVVRALPDGGALVVGNSLPIRLVDRFARGGGPRLAVLSQRGVNGIDGLVAGSLGAARALGAPLVALLGDLTTLHDVGALAAAPRSGPPIVIVTLRNGGGRIFEQLPVAIRADLAYAMPHVVTEHAASLAAAASALGVRGERIESFAALTAALRGALEREGTTLLEVIVPPHDAAEREARMRAAMERAG